MLATELLSRVAALQREVAQHKRTIRREKQALHAASERLGALEQECRRLGIRLIVHGVEGGDLHGQTPKRT